MTPTPRIIALKDVLARVEKATGLDREIDAAIYEKIMFKERPDEDYLTLIGGTRQHFININAPRYTSSLDACLSLAERVLPECVWEVDGGSDKRAPTAFVNGQWVGAATPALAFLAAILGALIAVEEKSP